MKKRFKASAMSIVFHLLTFLITLTMIVGIDIYRFNFDFSKITGEFLMIRALISIGYLMIKVSISNITYEMRQVVDPKFGELDITLEDASKKYRGKNFNEAIYKLDYSLKKDSWFKYIESKSFRHNTKIPKKVSHELYNLHEKDYSNRTKKWVKRRSELEEMSTEEWIRQHLINQNIDYETLSPMEVLYGTIDYNPKKTYFDRKPLARIIFRSLPFMILSFTGTILLGALAETQKVDKVGLFISIMSILLVLVMNIIIGVNNGLKAHRSRMLNMNKRSEIFVDYKEGHFDKLDPVPNRVIIYKENERVLEEARVNIPEINETGGNRAEDPPLNNILRQENDS